MARNVACTQPSNGRDARDILCRLRGSTYPPIVSNLLFIPPDSLYPDRGGAPNGGYEWLFNCTNVASFAGLVVKYYAG
jgi:hypothetical protein